MAVYTLEIKLEGIDQLSPMLKDVERELQSVARTAERSMERMGNSMQNAATSLRPLGFALAGIGAAIMGGIGVGVAKFASFEQAMANVKAVSGATAEEFAAMEAEALRIGETMGKFTAKDAAEGLNFLAMAGLSATESVAALEPTLKLAQAAQVEMGQAGDILTNIMTGMQIPVEGLTRVNDVLIKGFTSSNTNLVQLGEAFSYAAGSAHAAGLSVEETTAILGQFAGAGIRGTRAGTTLEAMLRMMARVTPQAQKELDKLGVSLTDAHGDFMSMPDIVRQFEDALAEVPGQAERLRVLSVIFGQAGARGINALLAQGSENLREFIDEMDSAGGTADRVAAIQTATLQEAFGELTSAVEGAALAVGQIFAPAVEMVADILKNLVGVFNSMPGPLKAVVAVLMGIVGAMALLAGATILMLGPLGSLLVGFSRFMQLGVIVRITAITRAMWALVWSIRAVRTALIASGIGALIVGGGFLLEAILSNRGKKLRQKELAALGVGGENVESRNVEININNPVVRDDEQTRKLAESVYASYLRAEQGAR